MAQTFSELLEADASGEISVIYAEMRRAYGVPYVSSLQRHLATYPGVLEFTWAVFRPGFLSGLIPERAWQLGAQVDEPPLPKLTRTMLRDMGVQEGDEKVIRAVCATFVRVAPVNLLFAGALRRVVLGEAWPDGPPITDLDWQPPEPLPSPPGMVAVDDLPKDQRETLLTLSTPLGRQTLVPGLYRMLANWPDYLAWVAEALAPRFHDTGVRERFEGLAAKIDACAVDILARLPVPPDGLTLPDPATAGNIVDAVMTYRRTSPEMIVFGSLLLNALPDPD